MFDQPFIDEVVSLALQIAKRARNEDHLQSLDIICEKFNHEMEELSEAENKWDEIPDIVYYSILAHVQGGNLMLKQLEVILRDSGVSIDQAKAACLAKYRLRAAGEPKNIEKERAAILATIQPAANLYALYQQYDTGFGGHADMRRVLLVWAADEQAALAEVKRDWESEEPEWRYTYEVTKVDLTRGAEPQQVYYWDNR